MRHPERPRMRQASRAGSILQQLLESQGMERKLREYRAWEVWGQVVGPQIARHAKPLRLRDGVLEVRVDQPIWMQQLRMIAPEILTKLNRALGEELIHEFFWRRGTLQFEERRPAPEPRKPLPRLTDQEQRQVDSATAAVSDDQLKSSLNRLFSLQSRLDKQRGE